MKQTCCKWVRERLPLLVEDGGGLAGAGGDVPGPERERIERHLDQCESCRARRAQLEQVMSVLEKAAGDPGSRPAGPTLWPELQARIRQRTQQSGPRPLPLPFPLRFMAALSPGVLGELAKSVVCKYERVRDEAPFHVAWFSDSVRELVPRPFQHPLRGESPGRSAPGRHGSAFRLRLAGAVGVLAAIASLYIPGSDRRPDTPPKPVANGVERTLADDPVDVVIKVTPITKTETSRSPSLAAEPTISMTEQAKRGTGNPPPPREAATVSAATVVPTSSPRLEPDRERPPRPPADSQPIKAAY